MISKFTRLTTSTRQTDRFLTVQAGERPNDKIVASGQVFALVEIHSRWFASAQVGQTLINSFFREYYRGVNSSSLVNFELAIRKTNETLAQITQNGETDWIGKLNALLMVIDKNEVHFSSVGNSEAYLFRNKVINQISEKTKKSEEIHPLKTFSNIISGNLKANDGLLVSNSVLMDYLSLDILRQLIDAEYPNGATMEIAKALKKEKVICVNCLVVKFFTKEKAADIPTDAARETIYLDQPLGTVSGALKDIYKIYLFPAGQKAGNFFKKIILPTGKKLWKNSLKAGANIGRYAAKQISAQSKTLVEKAKNARIKPESKIINKTSQSSSHNKIAYNVNRYIKPKANRIIPVLKIVGGFIKKIIRGFKNAAGFLAAKKNRRISYIIFAALLISILIFSISSRHSVNISGEEIINMEQDIKRAGELIEEGKMAAIYKEEGQAGKLFADALNLVLPFAKEGPKSAEARKILREAQEQLDKITKTTRFSDFSNNVKFPISPVRIFEREGKIYSLSADGKIYEGFLVEEEGKEIIDLNIGSAKIVSALLAEDKMLIHTSGKDVIEADIKTKEVNILKIENGEWEEAIDIGAYVGNIYLLDQKNGQIWKHSSTEKGFIAGGEYINKRKINLSSAISLAVDGNIYVLQSSGGILKLSRSKQQDFAIKGIPAASGEIANPLRIYTDADTDLIYLLDGGGEKMEEKKSPKILVFDKNGQFQKQYGFSADIEKISDFFVRPKSQKGWVLSGDRVYEIELE